jgi:hypothetical protein
VPEFTHLFGQEGEIVPVPATAKAKAKAKAKL